MPQFFAACKGVGLAVWMAGDTMKVRELMTTPPQTCLLDTSLAIVSRRMKETGCGTLIVLDHGGKPAGMLTDRDLALAIGESKRNASHIAAHEAMTEHVYTCSPDESLHTALERMSEARVRRLPVVTSDGDLQGILSIDDVVLWGVKSGGATRKELARALAAICAARDPFPEIPSVDDVTADV
jgi:CBS domain-containing protein